MFFTKFRAMFEDVTISHGTMLLVKLVLLNLYLATIAIISCVNGVVAFSLIVIAAASTVKYYKLDPEPFILLSVHTVVSCLMLYDPLTTLAVLSAVAVTSCTTGSVDVSSERAVVFLATVVLSLLLGRAAASVVAILVFVAIVVTKLRPLRPAVKSTLVLLLLALSLFVNGHVTAVLSTILVLVSTAYYLFSKFEEQTESLYLKYASTRDAISSHHNNNNVDSNNKNIPNGHIQLMNGGRLKLGNITDSVDLHGHTVTSALKTLHEFLKEHEDRYRQNRASHTRVVRVITGEDGKNHPEDQLNLIKPTVANFLKLNKYRFQAHPDKPGIIKIDLESHFK